MFNVIQNGFSLSTYVCTYVHRVCTHCHTSTFLIILIYMFNDDIMCLKHGITYGIRPNTNPYCKFKDMFIFTYAGVSKY